MFFYMPVHVYSEPYCITRHADALARLGKVFRVSGLRKGEDIPQVAFGAYRIRFPGARSLVGGRGVFPLAGDIGFLGIGDGRGGCLCRGLCVRLCERACTANQEQNSGKPANIPKLHIHRLKPHTNFPRIVHPRMSSSFTFT